MTASLVVLLGSFLEPILITKHFLFVDFLLLLLPFVIPSRIQRAQSSEVGSEVKCICGSSISSSFWILPKCLEGLRASEPHLRFE
jgi:hypothetical protein